MNDAAATFVRSFGLQPFEVEKILDVHRVPLHIMLGLIKTESSGHPEAMRYESGYKYLWDAPKYAAAAGWTLDTEVALQRFSFGLCQIMLATARWRGFNLHPMRLLEPKVGLMWGSLHLLELYRKYPDWSAAISAYNQGSPKRSLLRPTKFKNQKYVDRVLQYATHYGKEDATV